MNITTVPRSTIAYGLLPYKRNQDVIRIHTISDTRYVLAVCDGWNSQEEFSDDKPGRYVANFVANNYTKEYLLLRVVDPLKRALKACEVLDHRIAKKYPRLATCVASFVFHLGGDDIIVSVGDIETYLWKDSRWYKPKEINDHALDRKTYESNVARFFGASEHKLDPRFPGVFSAAPDVMTIPSNQPVLIATDGIKDVLRLDDINSLPVDPTKVSSKEIIETILQEISHRGTQRDDISFLVRAS